MAQISMLRCDAGYHLCTFNEEEHFAMYRAAMVQNVVLFCNHRQTLYIIAMHTALLAVIRGQTLSCGCAGAGRHLILHAV